MVVLAKEVEGGLGYILSPCWKTKAPSMVFILFPSSGQVEAGESGLEAVFLVVAFLITVIKYRTKAA